MTALPVQTSSGMEREALPGKFVENMRLLLGDESEAFFAALDEEAPVSVRLNLRKPGAVFEGAEPVKWCRSAFYLPERPEFVLDPLFHAGAYYVQEAASTIHQTIVERLSALSGGGPLRLLDMCAAPGGKTTAMINALPDGSEVCANEYDSRRAAVLRENLAKWGYPKVEVTVGDTARFAGSKAWNIVAVDAPCSGEGMMRKDDFARRQWSPELVDSCARLQRDILRNAAGALRPGGYLIYSTCTFNRRENEENARFIAEELGLTPVDFGFPEEWGIRRGIDTDLPVMRFMPHLTKGEGLFVAVFKLDNRDSLLDNRYEIIDNRYSLLDNNRYSSLDNRYSFGNKGKGKEKRGKEVGKGKGKKEEEDKEITVEEVLSVDYDGRLPEVELDETEARSYLRGEVLRFGEAVPKGPVVVTCRGMRLGLVKNIGPRANNLHPKSWRVRKE